MGGIRLEWDFVSMVVLCIGRALVMWYGSIRCVLLGICGV